MNDAAIQSQTPRSTYYAWETGRLAPSEQELVRLIGWAQVPADDVDDVVQTYLESVPQVSVDGGNATARDMAVLGEWLATRLKRQMELSTSTVDRPVDNRPM